MPAKQAKVEEGWENALEQVFATFAKEQQESTARMNTLEHDISVLKERLAAGCQSIIAPVESFDPDPYELDRSIKVLVIPDDGSWVATLIDTNINASGETVQEAVANLKETMIDLYEMLNERKDELGRHPARQFAFLKTVMHRKARHGHHH
jgi:predicted RNase H-like HicB family nuclease